MPRHRLRPRVRVFANRRRPRAAAGSHDATLARFSPQPREAVSAAPAGPGTARRTASHYRDGNARLASRGVARLRGERPGLVLRPRAGSGVDGRGRNRSLAAAPGRQRHRARRRARAAVRPRRCGQAADPDRARGMGPASKAEAPSRRMALHGGPRVSVRRVGFQSSEPRGRTAGPGPRAIRSRRRGVRDGRAPRDEGGRGHLAAPAPGLFARFELHGVRHAELLEPGRREQPDKSRPVDRDPSSGHNRGPSRKGDARDSAGDRGRIGGRAVVSPRGHVRLPNRPSRPAPVSGGDDRGQGNRALAIRRGRAFSRARLLHRHRSDRGANRDPRA